MRFLAGELVNGDGGRVKTLTCVGLYHWTTVRLGGGLIDSQDLKSSLLLPVQGTMTILVSTIEE